MTTRWALALVLISLTSCRRDPAPAGRGDAADGAPSRLSKGFKRQPHPSVAPMSEEEKRKLEQAHELSRSALSTTQVESWFPDRRRADSAETAGIDLFLDGKLVRTFRPEELQEAVKLSLLVPDAVRDRLRSVLIHGAMETHWESAAQLEQLELMLTPRGQFKVAPCVPGQPAKQKAGPSKRRLDPRLGINKRDLREKQVRHALWIEFRTGESELLPGEPGADKKPSEPGAQPGE